MANRMEGTPWHITYLKSKDGRRHKIRCRNFSPKNNCRIYKTCIGSSRCEKYMEKPKETKKSRKSRAAYEKRKKGVGLEDRIELYDSMNDIRLKIQIVRKEEADVGEGKISVDSPIGQAVLGKKKYDKIEIYTDKKVSYQIVDWIIR